ncbi:MAG: dephospho-CoA kinase [Candidatus Aenigmatarchaeota archaeon]
MNKKLVIGVTGCFGSGKTTVAGIIKKFTDCYVINADGVAKRIMAGKIREDIKSAFGTTDRKKLTKIVFNDKKKLALLGSIVHPHVIGEINKLVKASGKKIVVIDVPLLIESGMQDMTDRIILVKCKKNVIFSRLRDRFTKEIAEKIIKSQLPFDKKKKYADYVIDNSYSLSETKKKIMKICKLNGISGFLALQ